VSFKEALKGPNEMHVEVRDWSGSIVEHSGAWRWTTDAAPVVSFEPRSGVSRFPQFTILATDANGASDIAEVGFTAGDGDRSCTVLYRPATKEVRFLDKTWYLGTGESPEGPNCRVLLIQSRAVVSDTSITLTLSLEASVSLVGAHRTRVWVKDLSGSASDAEGMWTTPDEFPPTIAAPNVRNSASFRAGPIAPGEMFTIYGRNLGPTTAVMAGWDGDQLKTEINGTRVLVDGVPAPMIHIYTTQVTAIVPETVALSGKVKLQVTSGGRRSNEIEVPLAPAAPGIFGAMQAVAINEDGAYNQEQAAPRGSWLTFFMTGTGRNNLEYPAGKIPVGPNWPAPAMPVSAGFGDLPEAAPAFVGMVYTGVIQVNVKIPDDAPTGDFVPLRVRLGSDDWFRTESTVRIR
jgi:uncharacterized protein (TIGR03437 family)